MINLKIIITMNTQRGGEGAVRGAVEKILRGDGRWNDAVKKAFQVEL